MDSAAWTKTYNYQMFSKGDSIWNLHPVFGYTALVFDDQLWLLGCNRNGQFTSQVLHSPDGRHWIGSEAPWLPRGGVAAVVHRNQVFMTGGKYGGTPNHPDFRYDNDLWVMEKRTDKPDSSSRQSPHAALKSQQP